MTMSRPVAGLRWRNNSRVNRLARFRTTAPPILRVAAMPSLANPTAFAATNIVIYRPLTLAPALYACSNSARRVTCSTGRNVAMTFGGVAQTLQRTCQGDGNVKESSETDRRLRTWGHRL